jgi:hypothetical protein
LNAIQGTVLAIHCGVVSQGGIMQLPFTVEAFYDVFRDYNESVWPAQLLLIGLAIIAIALVVKSHRWSGAGVSGVLALLWAWVAVAYHYAYFSPINPLAYLFAVISFSGAIIFAWEGVIHQRLRFAWRGGIRSWIGALLVAFSLVIYPVWSWAVGHAYPYLPTFGLPCPTTLFTIGMLAWLVPPYPRSPHLVPILWSFIGAQAAFFLGVPQDLSLIVAGLVGIVLLWRGG